VLTERGVSLPCGCDAHTLLQEMLADPGADRGRPPPEGAAHAPRFPAASRLLGCPPGLLGLLALRFGVDPQLRRPGLGAHQAAAA
jgi:hypothetical protein